MSIRYVNIICLVWRSRFLCGDGGGSPLEKSLGNENENLSPPHGNTIPEHFIEITFINIYI
jgi:hypothetical protein